MKYLTCEKRVETIRRVALPRAPPPSTPLAPPRSPSPSEGAPSPPLAAAPPRARFAPSSPRDRDASRASRPFSVFSEKHLARGHRDGEAEASPGNPPRTPSHSERRSYAESRRAPLSSPHHARTFPFLACPPRTRVRRRVVDADPDRGSARRDWNFGPRSTLQRRGIRVAAHEARLRERRRF